MLSINAINEWSQKILDYWRTIGWDELVRKLYALNLSYRDHLAIMDAVYKENQFAYYDVANALDALYREQNNKRY